MSVCQGQGIFLIILEQCMSVAEGSMNRMEAERPSQNGVSFLNRPLKREVKCMNKVESFSK